MSQELSGRALDAALTAGRAARFYLQSLCPYWPQIDKCCCSDYAHSQEKQDEEFLRAALAAVGAG